MKLPTMKHRIECWNDWKCARRGESNAPRYGIAIWVWKIELFSLWLDVGHTYIRIGVAAFGYGVFYVIGNDQ